MPSCDILALKRGEVVALLLDQDFRSDLWTQSSIDKYRRGSFMSVKIRVNLCPPRRKHD
jgi:hypothetical protein